MKKTGIFFALFAAAICFSFVSDNACGNFEQFKNGTVFTMTNYNGKGEAQSTVTSTVSNVANTATGTSANIHAVIVDSKDKELNKVDYTITCEGGEMRMDMKSFASSAAASQGKDITMSFEGNTLNYPKTMAAGQALPEANMTMTASSGGSVVSTTKIKFYNRKVEAVESKTTTAGTWECYKISYMQDYEMSFSGMNIPGQARKSVEWFSYKVGTIRTESYKGDKIESYSELTALKKP